MNDNELPAGPVVAIGEASRRLARHPETLKRMARRGEIKAAINLRGRWFFDVAGFLQQRSQQSMATK